jgi:pilus assembly protein CpaD
MMAVALTACDAQNFTPNPKVATYDPQTRALTLPQPCPDWSQTQTQNYKNEPHSNFGCAVNTNLAVQLENPEDLHHGHGKATPDTETTTRVIEQYRAGDLPVALTPIQSTGTGE